MRESKIMPNWMAITEGKQQALAILKDKVVVNELASHDPTPTKKYVEVFARLLKAGRPWRGSKP